MSHTTISVLIAESGIELAHMLSRRIQHNAVEVNIASSGIHAKKQLAAQHYDYVIIDALTPSFDGVQLLRWLEKKQSATQVIFTKSTNIELPQLPNKNNIVLTIDKPYTTKSLNDLLRALPANLTLK